MVKVLLIQVDGKMENLALMKLCKYHRDKGDDVEFIDISGFEADVIYGSKIFMGGAGYDITAKLPDDIEILVPDYEKFNLDHSIGFMSRGCIRNCNFCIVREKEGYLHDVNDDWIEHSKVILLDNNFLASKKWKERLQFFIDFNVKVNFNQGLDIRLISEENAKLLSRVKYYDRYFRSRRLYFAFDDMSYESYIRKNVPILIESGIPSNYMMFYVIVGFNTDFQDDMRRYTILWDEYNVYPYVQIYNNRKDIPIIRHFARWVNKRLHKVVSWDEYYSKVMKKYPTSSFSDDLW